jgi:hypothetical protein
MLVAIKKITATAIGRLDRRPGVARRREGLILCEWGIFDDRVRDAVAKCL